MNFRITRSDYQRILAEERRLARLAGRTLTVGLLREALVQRGYEPILNEGDSAPDEGGESLDLQVDKHLNDYIKSSRETLQGEGSDPLRSFRRFLAEADDDDADAEEGAEDAAPEADVKPNTDEIDVEKLVSEVVNFIDNYQNLLEVKGVVIRRAVKLLKKDFDPSVAKNFLEMLRDRHDMEPGVTTSDVEAQEFVAPYAAQAGPVA